MDDIQLKEIYLKIITDIDFCEKIFSNFSNPDITINFYNNINSIKEFNKFYYDSYYNVIRITNYYNKSLQIYQNDEVPEEELKNVEFLQIISIDEILKNKDKYSPIFKLYEDNEYCYNELIDILIKDQNGNNVDWDHIWNDYENTVALA